jgi:lipopolysaccharide export LptBFGC system permease protein LptF
MTPATRRIRALAARVFGAATMERVIDPILSDIEVESRAHLERGSLWRARRAIASGYAGLCRAVVLQMLYACAEGCLFDAAAKRTMLASSAALAVLTVALMLPSLLRGRLFTQHPGLALYLVPQAIPLGIPIAVAIGIVWGWSMRPTGRSMLSQVVVVGTAGVLISLATMEWLVPAASDGFRDSVSRLLAPTGRTVNISRGIGERSLSELAALIRPTSQMNPFEVREYERALTNRHRMGTTRRRPLRLVESLQLTLHVRLALSFATFALGVLAAAVAATMRGRNHGRAVFGGLVVLYIAAWFGVEAMAPAVSPVVSPWLPNAAAVTTAVVLALSSFQRHHPSPTEA